MKRTRLEHVHVVWSPERFYFAVLDPSPLGSRPHSRRAARQTELGYLFENVLPVPIEQVQAVYVRAGPSLIVACAIERARLAKDLPADAVTLRPSVLPSFVAGQLTAQPELERFNMLVRDALPRAIARLRAHLCATALIAIVAAGALVMLGASRRAFALEAHARLLSAARHALYNDVLGEAAAGSLQPRELQLIAQLRQLRQTRNVDMASLTAQADVAGHLEGLLARWPRDGELHVSVQSIAVSPAAITVRAGCSDTQQAQRLIDAIGGISGWRMAQPTIRAAAGEGGAGQQGAPVEIDLQLEPASAPTEGPPG